MDDQGFDRLARAVAAGHSRRAVVKVLVSAAGGLLAVWGGRRAGAAGDKVPICHLTGSETNPVVLIEVGADAVPAHEAHGDAINPDFGSDPEHCGGCGKSCGAGQACVNGSCQGTCLEFGAFCDPANNECCALEGFVMVCCDPGNGRHRCFDTDSCRPD